VWPAQDVRRGLSLQVMDVTGTSRIKPVVTVDLKDPNINTQHDQIEGKNTFSSSKLRL
jgi:hypothetical protein